MSDPLDITSKIERLNLNDSDSNSSIEFRNLRKINNSSIEFNKLISNKSSNIESNLSNNLIKNNSNKVFEMTESAVTFNTLQKYIDLTPPYDGDPAVLAIFISACEYLIATFGKPTANDPINSYILHAILAKLRGRALELIGSREDATSWHTIKTLLQQYFGDQRDENCLMRDLLALKPNKGESSYQFGTRCQDYRSLILTKVRLTEPDANTRAIKTKMYDNMALQAFLQGLPGYMGLAVRLQKPETLEKAMGLVIEEENFAYVQNRQNSINSPINYKPVQRFQPAGLPPRNPLMRAPPPQQQFVRKMGPPPMNSAWTYNQQRFNQPPTSQPTFRPQFGTSNWRPFNSQPPPMSQQQPNRFASNHVHPKPQSYPTPMDTSSGYTSRRTQQRPTTSAPQKNWVAEELFYQDDGTQEKYYETFEEESYNQYADQSTNNENQWFEENQPYNYQFYPQPEPEENSQVNTNTNVNFPVVRGGTDQT